jgi:hypothetical protein
VAELHASRRAQRWLSSLCPFFWPCGTHNITVGGRHEQQIGHPVQHHGYRSSGAQIDIEQGQTENGKKQLQGFRSRFQAVSETCMNCHDTERHYFVDNSIIERIDKLDQAYQATPVDAALIGRLTQGIGMESCFKCHLVHVPAAAAQATLKPH